MRYSSSDRKIARIIRKYKNLKWIHFGSIGTDKINNSSLKNKKIIITNSKTINSISVAKLVFIYLLDIEKKILKLNNFSNRDIYEKKIENNEYTLVKNKCPCNRPNSDELIASRDRFGIKLFSYVCKNCGLIRQNPTLDEKSLKKFYSQHYRNIYEGEVHSKHFEKIFKSQQESGKNIYSLIQNVVNRQSYYL